MQAETSKEIGSDTLFVVVFQEIQHVRLDIVYALPASRNRSGRTISAYYGTKGIVQPHLIIQVIEMSVEDIITIFVRIIDFGNENQLRMQLFHLRNDPAPELARYHFRHVATETVYAFGSPKEQDILHLVPSIRNR